MMQETAVADTAPVDVSPMLKGVEHIVFEYTGKTAMSARGSITGRQYRFNFPGDTQLVDSRDANGMTAVPNLKRRKRAG